MKNHLIIGGAGFIGCNLAAHLLKKGKDVVIFDNFSRQGTHSNASWLKTVNHKVKIIHGDIRFDQKKLIKAVKEADIVYHLAAQVAVTTSVVNPREDFEINALGTLNVLEAARQLKEKPILIFSSTNKVYGQIEGLKLIKGKTRYKYRAYPFGISEEQNLDFHSPYGCSKGTGDQYVRDYARIYNLPTVVFRQSCIYGPHQFGVEDQGWVAWFTIASLLKRPMTIYGDGKQVRDVLHVADLINAFEMAATQIKKTKGKIYNIGGGFRNTLSLLELIDYLEKLLGEKIKYDYSDWRPGDQLIYISDIRKAEKEFGWKPKMVVKEGVKDLFNWVKENSGIFENI